MNNLTEEQKADVKARVDEWTKKGEELEVAVVAYPQLVQTETGNFEITVIVKLMDTKYAPKPTESLYANKD